jgi:hypothetical protein
VDAVADSFLSVYDSTAKEICRRATLTWMNGIRRIGGAIMWRTIIGVVVALVLPASVSAGPIAEAVAKAGREVALAQAQEDARNRGRLWTGIALLAGGATMSVLGGVEIGDDETGPDDGEDLDESDDGEDSDGWGNKALIGGGVATAALGAFLIFTSGRDSGPSVSMRPGRVTVRHTIKF